MSVKSQEKNMRKLAELLDRNLGYIWGEREGGPNGDKKVFLNTGKAFLRALAKDLGFVEYKVSANPGGIAVPGDCILVGMWENSGLYIDISQFSFGPGFALLYRSVRHIRDYSGGHNQFITHRELETLSYDQLVEKLNRLRKGGAAYEQAA